MTGPPGRFSTPLWCQPLAGLSFPTGLVFGPAGRLYVSSFGTNAILRYDGTTGAFLDTFVTPGNGELVGPAALVFFP